ncbi:MAG: hypothetical protein RI988_3720 [Pseudomonadota bacterium]|jgi:flagellar biosynthesis chaperone FliJ
MSPPRVRARLALALALALTPAFMAHAQATGGAGTGIYTCVDGQGRRITSDRPIPECAAREQQQLNRDGSLQRTVPPVPTAQERAEQELRERRAAEARAAQTDAMRQDRNLLQRYKTPQDHQRAREAALDAARSAVTATDQRLASLAQERKQYTQEAEFYRGKPMPAKLQQQIEAVDASMAAQRAVAQNQRAELDRINRLYDAELERLKRLWAGEAPGSIGPAAATPATPPAPGSAGTSATSGTPKR